MVRARCGKVVGFKHRQCVSGQASRLQSFEKGDCASGRGDFKSTANGVERTKKPIGELTPAVGSLIKGSVRCGPADSSMKESACSRDFPVLREPMRRDAVRS